MWAKGCNMRKIAALAAAALLALSLNDKCCVLAEYKEAGCDEYGYDAYPCPSPQPMLEVYPGWSLYWHDPCQGDNTFVPAEHRHPSTPAVWYALADYVPLFRDQSGELPFQTLGPDGNVVLGTNDFDAEFNGGARVTVGRSLGDWYRLEGSWLGSFQWSDEVAVRNLDQYDLNGDGALDAGTSGNLYSPFSGFGTPGVNPTGVLGLDFNRFASIQFSSEFNSVELNVRRRLHTHHRGKVRGEAAALVGLRYMNVTEDFSYLTASNVPAVLGSVNDVNVQTRNDLFGFQLGYLAQLLVADRAWIDVDLKGAIFGNRAEQSTVYTNTNNVGVTTVFPGRADGNRTAFLGDLSVVFNYQCAPSWTFRVGYNAIGLTGVALGHENFNSDVNILQLGPAAIDHSGSVVYHGPTIGLVWTR